jgi:uncharacterized protein YecE (DUF72 family)
MVSGKIRIGISGWRYAPWRGVFYPADLPQSEELAYASHQFPTIEINGSFYSLQTPQSYASWYEDTPEDFVFSVKAPRFITHIRRLREVDKALANFFASGVLRLRQKLGPVLWQLPPSLRYDADLVSEFLGRLPHSTEAALKLARRREPRMNGRCSLAIDRNRRLRHALEVRHASFCNAEFTGLLRRHRIALVVSDSGGHWPMLEEMTADFAYIRLHGGEVLYSSSYGPAALRQWQERIDRWRGGDGAARDVYCYFDNDAKVKAPENALELERLLRQPSAPRGNRQEEALSQ